MLALTGGALDTLSMGSTGETVSIVHESPKLETAAAIGRVSLSVGVCCSAYEVPDVFAEPAREFVRLLAHHGHTLVWGGSDVGLMKEIASVAQNEGAKIIGVTEDSLQKYARKNADEMIITGTLAERKAVLLERSDAIGVLIGGTGTLDEITEVVEHKKYKRHDKPIVVLNTDNFYDGYRLQMQRMSDEKMLKYPIEDFVYFADTPEDAVKYINRFAGNDTTGEKS